MAYQIINDILKSDGSNVTAAEAHGIAAGILCVDSRATEEQWMFDIFGDDVPQGDDRQVLTDLFNQTRVLINNEEYAFDLFLQEDEQALSERVESLREWCQGFLFGVGYASSSKGRGGSKKNDGYWPKETGEILKDVVEFTKLNPLDDDDQSEENETAYAEINEYLRVAVLLIRDDLDSLSDIAH